MEGDTIYSNPDVFTLRENAQDHLLSLEIPLTPIMSRYGFYPKVFLSMEDINHPVSGIRNEVPNLDQFNGVFIEQDSPDTPIDRYNGIEFRTSLDKSIAKSHGRQFLWTYTDLSGGKPLPGSDYDPMPSVQFAGTAVFQATTGQPFPQQQPRFRAAMLLSTSGILNQTYLIQQMFQNGRFIEYQNTKLNRDDYLSLMTRHPYGLSVRGWGNWSFRFYELMAYGRIPVHIHTNDELLFEDIINYDEYIVRVNNPKNIRQKIEEFHSQFTDSRSLRFHQKKLRSLYEQYLTFPAFVKHFDEYYEDRLRKTGIDF